MRGPARSRPDRQLWKRQFLEDGGQVSAYVDGLHDALRAKAGQHVITLEN